MPDLGCQIVATQRDAEQEPHPGHDPIAVADAGPALDQVQLKSAHLVGRCRIGRAFEPGGEPLATVNVATLGVRVELAPSHVFDHTQTQRTDGVSIAHGELYEHLDSQDRGSPLLPLLYTLNWLPASRLLPPAQRAGAQRLRAGPSAKCPRSSSRSGKWGIAASICSC